jgi:hypothetical protein
MLTRGSEAVLAEVADIKEIHFLDDLYPGTDWE